MGARNSRKRDSAWLGELDGCTQPEAVAASACTRSADVADRNRCAFASDKVGAIVAVTQSGARDDPGAVVGEGPGLECPRRTCRRRIDHGGRSVDHGKRPHAPGPIRFQGFQHTSRRCSLLWRSATIARCVHGDDRRKRSCPDNATATLDFGWVGISHRSSLDEVGLPWRFAHRPDALPDRRHRLCGNEFGKRGRRVFQRVARTVFLDAHRRGNCKTRRRCLQRMDTVDRGIRCLCKLRDCSSRHGPGVSLLEFDEFGTLLLRQQGRMRCRSGSVSRDLGTGDDFGILGVLAGHIDRSLRGGSSADLSNVQQQCVTRSSLHNGSEAARLDGRSWLDCRGVWKRGRDDVCTKLGTSWMSDQLKRHGRRSIGDPAAVVEAMQPNTDVLAILAMWEQLRRARLRYEPYRHARVVKIRIPCSTTNDQRLFGTTFRPDRLRSTTTRATSRTCYSLMA